MMHGRVGNLQLQIGAVVVAMSSALSVGTIAAALPSDSDPGETTSVPGDETLEPDDSTSTSSNPTTIPTTTAASIFERPAARDPLATGSRPGTTFQTKTPPPPSTTTTVPSWVLPTNSGSGRRAVYSKSLQRVWAVDSNGTVLKTHLVSGKLTWCDPRVGEYRVYSRSRYTNSIQKPSIKWGYMIRFAKGCGGGNIGFHEIPKQYGVPLQSVSQLGTPLSAGCVRQGLDDAKWMWNWAWNGTKVVVLP
mgnify:CR=1 FL=1